MPLLHTLLLASALWSGEATPAPEPAAGTHAVVVTQEAENGRTNGEVLPRNRSFGTLAAEASGRSAVVLRHRGDWIAFRLTRPANSITVRYAIPDGPGGKARDASLSVDVGTRRIASLPVTSRYSWFYGHYPFSNDPAEGRAHHFYDHARLRFGRTLPVGSVLRLVIGRGDDAPWYAIDLIEFEAVPPPLPRPPAALSVADFGADPSGKRESRASFQAALAEAARTHHALWVPPGRYRIDGTLTLDMVELTGAGAWHSELSGDGVGLYGKPAPGGSTAVSIHDLAIIGEVTERDDHKALAGIGGALGGGSVIRDVFIQHVKAGIWLDGPFDGLMISRIRVLDTIADGINLHRGVSHVVLEDSYFRNTGDDGIAAWSQTDADHDIVIRRNTVVAPILANGVALYGGHDIEISDNLIADTVTEGGGLHLGNRFGAVPLSGRIDVRDNTVLRGGSLDPNWHYGVGALWLYALDAPIHADIVVRGTRLVDSSEDAVLFTGKAIDGVTLEGLDVRGGAGPVITARSTGSATVTRLTSADLRDPTARLCAAFRLDGAPELPRAPCQPPQDSRMINSVGK